MRDSWKLIKILFKGEIGKIISKLFTVIPPYLESLRVIRGHSLI